MKIDGTRGNIYEYPTPQYNYITVWWCAQAHTKLYILVGKTYILMKKKNVNINIICGEKFNPKYRLWRKS